MMGPPGGGKGTYSSRISEEFEIPHVATGDIFRDEVDKGSELGKKIEEYLEEGELVPDKTVNDVVRKRLSKPDCDDGFILDGYPRTLNQVNALAEIKDIDLLINLDVSEEVIIERLSNRRICQECGEIYNLKSLPSEEEGVCDECGGELYQREDDKPEVIKKRLEEYKKRAEPILEFYRDKGVVEDIVFEEERPIEEAMEEIKTLVNEFKA